MSRDNICQFQMWIYVTWIFWLGVHAAWYLWLLLVGGSIPLWICFLQSWRGDPGVITATHEDKLNVSILIACAREIILFIGKCAQKIECFFAYALFIDDNRIGRIRWFRATMVLQ